jgi:RNA polymerase-binding protein DksA
MPPTAAETHSLKRRLEERFNDLRMEIARELRESDEAPYIELAGQVHDPGEASVAELLKDLSLASVDRHIEEIRAIDAALMRMARGTYGVCAACGKPIDFDRLQVQPSATRCQECQARWEKTGSTGPRKGPSL